MIASPNMAIYSYLTQTMCSRTVSNFTFYYYLYGGTGHLPHVSLCNMSYYFVLDR